MTQPRAANLFRAGKGALRLVDVAEQARRRRRWYDQVIPLSELSAARGYLQSVFSPPRGSGSHPLRVTPSRGLAEMNAPSERTGIYRRCSCSKRSLIFLFPGEYKADGHLNRSLPKSVYFIFELSKDFRIPACPIDSRNSLIVFESNRKLNPSDNISGTVTFRSRINISTDLILRPI